ncbi:MAG: hypothetical protein ACI4BA_08795 [Prevotella sp.]
MKRLVHHFSLWTLALMTMFALSACENEDSDTAYDLNGIWQGEIVGSYYSYRYGVSTERWDTEIQFYQNGAFSNGGWGEQRDYNTYGRFCKIYRFDWTVNHGQILIVYSDGYRVLIRDYDLYSVGRGMRFRGYMDGYDDRDFSASFDLVKVSNWTDWDY